MCGIAGFVRHKETSTADMQRLAADTRAALAALAHRGPDDEGVYLDHAGGTGLGHRRLAVIDLSARGRQPMCSPDGAAVVVYNGEIYNFKTLRRELEACGYTFSTATDTEVVLNAYRQWGPDCLPRFNGMFALAIWQPRAQKLFLARDRHGVKPLFYHTGAQTFLFASELKGLMAYDLFAPQIDQQALALFLHYQYVPAPATIFQNTYKLLPGHWLVCAKGHVESRPWWQIPRRAPRAGYNRFDSASARVAVDELEALLSDAVEACLISDAPLGAFLSGGVDSSLVVALMQKHSRRRVKTFSIGFESGGYNEAPYARRVAAHIGTEHTEFTMTPADALQEVHRLATIYDEPFADASAIPTCRLSRLARAHVTVALSGDGGDEQFCGYVRYWSTRAVHRLQRRLPLLFTPRAARWAARLPLPHLVRLVEAGQRLLPGHLRIANPAEKLIKLQRLAVSRNLPELYRETIALWPADQLKALMGIAPAAGRYEAGFATAGRQAVLSTLLQVDQATWLPDAMLTKVDRASMAAGLEVRVPLLDHRITEFAAGLPENLLYHNGHGKWILKQVLARHVPAELFMRPKMGFAIPLARWLRHELKAPLQDYLSAKRLHDEGLFQVGLVQQQLKEHLSGRQDHHYRLWALLMWEMWRETWL